MAEEALMAPTDQLAVGHGVTPPVSERKRTVVLLAW